MLIMVQQGIHLKGQVVILLLLLRAQRVPPLAQDFGNSPVVLIRMALVNESPVPFAENHERVHRSPHVILLLGLQRKKKDPL